MDIALIASGLNMASSLISGASQGQTQAAAKTTGSDSSLSSVEQKPGVDTSTLPDAMRQGGMKPQGTGGARGHHHGRKMGQVAQQLGVQTDALESAFKSAMEQLRASSSTGATSATSNTEVSKSDLLGLVAKQLDVDPQRLVDAMKQSGAKVVDQHA